MISSGDKFADPKHEFWMLLEGLCEDRLSPEQFERLEDWVLSDAKARWLYRDYIELHGALYWDAALSRETVSPKPVSASREQPVKAQPTRRSSFKLGTIALACLLLVGLGVGLTAVFQSGPNDDRLANRPDPSIPAQIPPPHENPGPEQNNSENNDTPGDSGNSPENDFLDDSPWPAIAERRPEPRKENPKTPKPDNENNVAQDTDPKPPEDRPRLGSVDEIVASIDSQIRRGWDDAEIQPSPIADDSEWIRRVHLDLVGQIPPPETVRAFLEDRREDKRARMIGELLEDPAYVRNFATVWTNLLVGRSTERDVDRLAVHRFLRRSFGRNRPWSEVVADLISAEGPAEENGASGFLLAHLNNQAVPATAITARLFLCTKVQCTQCHKHPQNDADQSQFWELNSFFKQTAIERRQVKSPGGGTRNTRALVSKREGGPTFYEDLSGVMKTAYPKFAGVKISPKPGVNRRRQLAELITKGESPQIARAMVNRMWSHFFGYGFTRPVDDMGPHNPPSHPELLDRLTEEFVQSGYDVKQLIRWICLSDPYQRSSQFAAGNELDDPSIGETPLFSRMYVRPMTAEQLYDSLLIASRAHLATGSSWGEIQKQRQDWLQQFVTAFDTEENDEETLFEGTVPQALLLMNSELIDQAVRPDRGTYFAEVLHSPAGDAEKIRRLCLAALSRYPTPQETAAARQMLRSRRGTGNPNARTEAFQDIFWAFLNSNEFILVH